MSPLEEAMQDILLSLCGKKDRKITIGQASGFERERLRDGMVETPTRAMNYLKEMTAGYLVADDEEIKTLLKTFEDGAEGVDQMVFQGSIPFYSLCEHHVAPFFGVVHIGYIPNKKIVGLSKMPRLVDAYSRRFQVQERLTNQIADAMEKHLEPMGVGVAVRARHLCMESRGVRASGTTTYTSALRGGIKTDATAREEFLHFVAMAEKQGSL